MIEAELVDLEKLAKEATPGPWSVPDPEKYGEPNWSYVESANGHICITHVNGIYRQRCKEDAFYIAALHPQAALTLIDAIRTLRERVGELEATQRPPCGFSSNSVNVWGDKESIQAVSNAFHYAAEWEKAAKSERARATVAEARLTEAEKVMEPFAEVAAWYNKFGKNYPDEQRPVTADKLELGQYRAVAAFLSRKAPSDD